MTAIRRPQPPNVAPTTAVIFGALFVFVFLLAVMPDSTTPPASLTNRSTSLDQNNNNNNNNNNSGGAVPLRQKLQHTVHQKRQALREALNGLTEWNIPQRLRALRDKHEIIGERLSEISAGQETAEEILHGHKIVVAKAEGEGGGEAETAVLSDKPPMELDEIIVYLDSWIHQLHEALMEVKHATFEGIWQAYHDLTVKTLYPWDREYLQRMPRRRKDGSIFLSVATYRDENCFNTVYYAYKKAKDPEKLFVGLVQQNCHSNCRSGVLSNLSMVPVPPDDDCYQLFCDSDIGKEICERKQVRVLNIDEPESLGPYAARYFASKLWYGESWYMQTDAHMTFKQDWDAISVAMLQRAPSEKPILSHYPPGHTVNLENLSKQPCSRLCGPVFATSDLESQIIRLEGGGRWDNIHLDIPAFAPFTAAGYFVSHSGFLKEVPFDPFLPWIFMGEEIIMSSRLWTSGYDIFSPSEAVVGHIYVRRHKPKFWESVHRAFTVGIHNPLQMMVLDRVKYQLGYPEAAKDMLRHRSILTAVEQYSMGSVRPLEKYLEITGLNMTSKEVTYTGWCEKGYPPPGFEKFDHLYPDGVKRRAADTKLAKKFKPKPKAKPETNA